MQITNATTYISRNDFLRFIQCKKTWYLRNLKTPLKTSTQLPQLLRQSLDFRNFRPASENKVIEYARSLFVSESISSYTVERDLPLNQKINKTRELLEKQTGMIFNAWFEHRGVALFIDILQMNEGWKAYAIRPGGGSSYSHTLDMALQYYILKKNGIDLTAFSAIYINKRYLLKGTLNISQFFRVRDFLPDIGDSLSIIEKTMDEISKTISESDIKDIDIGNHCYHPSPCPYMNVCWNHIPENSVFEIASLDRGLKFQMYHKGILHQKDIKREDYPELTPNQILQIESTIQQKTTLQQKELHEFLGKIKYPVHYLDFESFMPVIPLYLNTHPLQHIPFEYCLYSKSSPNSAPDFRMFLAEANLDPRREFIINLLRDIGTSDSGSILVYDSRLEIQQLREIAGLYPEFKDSVESVISRIIDLTYPFHKKYYYAPQMKGLYSIKSLLPALFPDMSYDNLAIKNGFMAMHAFESLFYENRSEVIARTRADLKEYCKMDVLALVEIHRFLENLVVQD